MAIGDRLAKRSILMSSSVLTRVFKMSIVLNIRTEDFKLSINRRADDFQSISLIKYLRLGDKVTQSFALLSVFFFALLMPRKFDYSRAIYFFS